MTYIYYFNYQENEDKLCALEFETLFHQKMKSNILITDTLFDFQRSVYIKGRLSIIAQAPTIEELVEKMNKQNLLYYDFKAQYIKNDITHVAYQESLEALRRICHPIKGSVNIKSPKIIIGLTKFDDIWYVGEYESNLEWSKHLRKPHSYSHSLNTRDARTCVNLVLQNNTNQTLIDPCCGVGTVVLEALSMNAKVKGYDINRYVSYQARLNLEYFNYDPYVIEKKDMTTITEHFDCCVLDIPYGVYSPFSYEQQLELIEATTHFTSRLVLISHVDMSRELENVGYTIENKTSITKGSFTRYITIGNL